MEGRKKYLFYSKMNRDEYTDSVRTLCTPGFFAKSTLFYIQEIGRLKSLKGHISSREKLDSYLFLIVLSGNGILKYENRTYRLTAGDHILIDCEKSYSHESNEEHPWELMWVHFNGKDMGRYFLYYRQKYEDLVFRPSSPTEYIVILEQLMQAAGDHSSDAELLVSHLLNGLITRILTRNLSVRNTSSTANEKISSITKYLDEHFKDKIPLEYLAGHFYISKFYMSREFKRSTGLTVLNYIANKRITYAKELLRFSDLQIEEIARICGIEDNSYFNRVFKKVEGLSASEYRKKWRGKP